MIRFTRATIFLALFTCTLIAASQEQQQQQQDQPQSQPPAQSQHRAHARAATPQKADDDSTAQEPPANPRADVIRENNFGVSLMNRQQFEKALGKFQRACILDPQTDIGCLNSGIAFLNMQRFDEARAILQKSAERDPRNPWAWFNLGLMEKAGGDADAAIADFQKVAALDAYDADTQYFLGLIYSQQQQYDKAIASFKRALELNPFQVSAEFGMAQALQRSGKTADAKIHFDRFQHMTSQKLGKPVSFIYGEQGKYSLAEILQPAPEPVPQAMPVHFVNVTAAANLPTSAAARVAAAQANATLDTTTGATATGSVTIGARRTRGAKPPAPNSPTTLAKFLGSGACIIDYNSDGKPDIFLADADGRGNSALYKNIGGGKFLNVTHEARLEIHGQQMGCAVGDYDNDGKPDLAVSTDGRVILFHNEGNGTFKDVTKDSGIDSDAPADTLALGLTFIDFDHDGDLDLYVTRFNDFPLATTAGPFEFPTDVAPPGNVLWRNNGNGTFTNWTTETALAGTAPSIGALASDINNDRAIDFVVTGWQKSPVAYLNPREGAFQSTTPWSSDMPAPTAGVAALDFDKDGWMDLAFTHWGAPGLSLWRNNNGKSFERVNLPDLDWMRGWGVAPIDYDDDGWIDLVAVGEDFSGAGHIVLLRNEGSAGFRDVTASTGLDKIALRNPRAIIAFDFDNDGATDLLITQNNLPPVLLKNDGGNRYNWIKIALKGENDNKSAIGTKVEMYAGALQQKWEVPGASGYLGQGPAPIVAGLGAERQADVIRLLWPTGVLQDELEIPAHKEELITEIDRRGSSCPIVFVWNGQKFEFLADMIGPGIVGHWTGPNQRNIPNPAEYFKVTGSLAQPQEGRLRFKMLEPMEELDYLDQTRLLAIDHPNDVEVYPNEHFASELPFPQFKVIASRDAHLPVGAWDDHSRNILPLLREQDHKYVTNFPLAPYAGFAEMHMDRTRPRRLGFLAPAPPADGRLHRLFQRQLDVRRVASRHHPRSALRRSARRLRPMGEGD